MKLGLGEIMKMASEKESHREKIEFLRKHDSVALRTCFRLAYDDRLEWDFPKGWKPEFRTNEFLDQESNLYQSMRNIGKFLVDGYPGLKREKKQTLFVQLLEGVSELDAQLLIGMKDGKIPWKGLGKKTIQEAFPEIQFEEEKKETIDAVV